MINKEYISKIKSLLIRNDWSDAITLFDYLIKNKKEELSSCIKSGDTARLMEISESFKKSCYYRDFKSKHLAFENDVYALDSVFLQYRNTLCKLKKSTK